MAELDKTQPNQFEKRGVNPFNNPTPGESLTRDPEQKFPWEQPVEFNDVEPVIKEIFINITEKEKLLDLLHLLRKGTPIDELTQVILYKGMTQGLYNTDLMMLLIEPTLYLLIAIADYADIKDYTLYTGEETDPDAEIHGDDVEPVDFDAEENEDEEIKTDKMAEPKAESLGESLLSRVESELPSKVEQLKGDM